MATGECRATGGGRVGEEFSANGRGVSSMRVWVQCEAHYALQRCVTHQHHTVGSLYCNICASYSCKQWRAGWARGKLSMRCWEGT